ncbi:immunoglobulin kappa light chain-like [Alligator sinensis]|uniref:immunoglobulin kappa light chain-like n=1 Tax=Alligator sinensis TaxID=38654 RepID=UPI000D720994|nr:immunoglobulin kappa light chain-like [Alligator sinensis]
MLVAGCLLLSVLALGAALSLHQTPPVLFAEVGGTAEILCSPGEPVEGGKGKYYWYLRREGKVPTCVWKCLDDKNKSRFACRLKGGNLTLEISSIQQNDAGIYYCAVILSFYLAFGNGSRLIVGDSYTPSASVLLLAASPQGTDLSGTADLACLVRGVSNPVHVAWTIPGASQEQQLTRSVKGRDGALMFINHISIPVATWASAAAVTCEVWFNSSGSSVQRSAWFRKRSNDNCIPAIGALAALGTLTLLMIPDGIIYAQLDLESRRHRRRKQ